MVFLGFGKYARADKIYALEPLGEGERGHGRRTRVWIEGVPDPIVASRTERTILHDMGHDTGATSPIVDDALELAERLVEQTDGGRVDLADLSRRARRLLEATSQAGRGREAVLSSLRRAWRTNSTSRVEAERPAIAGRLARLPSTSRRCGSRSRSAGSGSGTGISAIGSQITSVAIPFQVYELTHSTLLVGLLVDRRRSSRS